MGKKKVIELENTDEVKLFIVTELMKQEGYTADIDGIRFVITPEIRGLTIDVQTTQRIMGIITPSECWTHNVDGMGRVIPNTSKKMEEHYFTNLTEKQERLLRIAGVII